MAVRVFHCDDSEAFRVLVREMLAEEPDIDLVGAAGDAEGAVAGARELDPDVVLLDLRGGDLGPELTGRVAAAAPRARIVVLSGWTGPIDESQIALRLDKDVSFEDLAAAIRRLTPRA